MSPQDPLSAPQAFPSRDLEACPLCGARSLQAAHFQYLFESVTFPAVRCLECGLFFLARQPTAEGLARLYDAEYFQSDYHCGHEESDYFANESGQIASARVLLAWIEEHVPPGRILEIGCAGGYFLKAASDRGWSPMGIEISDSAAQFARQQGVDVRTGTLDEVELPAESFDTIYLGDVLEHLPSPRAALTAAHRLLRPGGVILVAGPVTLNSLDRRLGLLVYRILGKTKSLHQPPYHLVEFTPQTLAHAMRLVGFSVAWIRQSKIPPKWHNPRLRSPLEHTLKFFLDGPNWALTRATGHLGDRAVVLARKPVSPSVQA